MFYPLLVSRQENARLLTDITKKLDTKERKLIGTNWSMTELLKSLRNYTMINVFVLDMSAIAEKDDDFLSMLEGLQLQRPDARIVIFAEDYKEGDEFLDKLVTKGYVNIVAKCSKLTADEQQQWAMMKEDLEECFSDNGLSKEKYSKYIIRKAVPEIVRPPAEEIVPIQRQLTYNNCNACFSFVGTQPRIGTTSTAIACAAYFAAHGAKVAYINSDPDYITLLAWTFAKAQTDTEGNVEINGIKFIKEFGPQVAANHNIIIKDIGTVDVNKPVNSSDYTGVLYLVCGVTYDEAGYTRDAEYALGDIPYTLLVNFATEEMYQRCAKELGHADNVQHLVLPWIPDKLSLSPDVDLIFDSTFAQFADEEEVEEIH